MLLAVAISSICLTSCGDDDDVNNAPTEPNVNGIVGTWRNPSPANGNLHEQYLFQENGDYTYVVIESATSFVLEAGTYRLESSGVLSLNCIRGDNPGRVEYSCSIDGNKMEITGQNGHTSYSRVENNAGNITGTWECEQLNYDGTYTHYTYVFNTNGTYSYEVPSAFGGLNRESGRYSLDPGNGLITFNDENGEQTTTTYMLIDDFLIINGLQIFTRTSGGIVDVDDSIVGSWLYEEPGYREIYTFNADGTFTDTYNDEFETSHKLTGNYETSGNTLTLHYMSNGTVIESETVTFSVSGNVLTLTDSDGDSITLSRIE